MEDFTPISKCHPSFTFPMEGWEPVKDRMLLIKLVPDCTNDFTVNSFIVVACTVSVLFLRNMRPLALENGLHSLMSNSIMPNYSFRSLFVWFMVLCMRCSNRWEVFVNTGCGPDSKLVPLLFMLSMLTVKPWDVLSRTVNTILQLSFVTLLSFHQFNFGKPGSIGKKLYSILVVTKTIWPENIIKKNQLKFLTAHFDDNLIDTSSQKTIVRILLICCCKQQWHHRINSS